MHIYKKPDFSNDDSMGRKILLVLCNRLYITTTVLFIIRYWEKANGP